jgi:hypothetical protein
MGAFRVFLMRKRGLALGLVALALVMKALIPAGFMPGRTATSSFTVLVCADATGGHDAVQVVVQKGTAKPEVKANQHCAFAGLGMAALGGAEPALLALALAFIVALGFGPVALPHVRRFARVLPPPCGPPALS